MREFQAQKNVVSGAEWKINEQFDSESFGDGILVFMHLKL